MKHLLENLQAFYQQGPEGKKIVEKYWSAHPMGDRITKLFSINKPQEINVMNEQNFDFLKNQLKYTGFGEDLQKNLRERLSQQQPAFTLSHCAEFSNDQANVTLYFKKSEQSDMYFFNRHELSLKKDKEDESMKQFFYIGRENNITLKEGYNMINRRSILKYFLVN